VPGAADPVNQRGIGADHRGLIGVPRVRIEVGPRIRRIPHAGNDQDRLFSVTYRDLRMVRYRRFRSLRLDGQRPVLYAQIIHSGWSAERSGISHEVIREIWRGARERASRGPADRSQGEHGSAILNSELEVRAFRQALCRLWFQPAGGRWLGCCERGLSPGGRARERARIRREPARTGGWPHRSDLPSGRS
jgi:hypothetical protein